MKTSMANMQITKSILLNAANLLVPTSWTARTNTEMAGMVDPLRLEGLHFARVLEVEAAKSSRSNTKVKEITKVARIFIFFKVICPHELSDNQLKININGYFFPSKVSEHDVDRVHQI